MDEMWKMVPGYEGIYEVSNIGSVRSLNRLNDTCYGASRVLNGKVTTQITDKGGYANVSLSKDGKSKKHRVHRLVMSAFLPTDMESQLDVNHKDGNKLNNRIDNLEWCTRGDNHKHRYRVLGQKHSFEGRVGAQHSRSKPVIGMNLQTGEKVFFESANLAAKTLGMCFSQICACARGDRKTHKGFSWSWLVHTAGAVGYES